MFHPISLWSDAILLSLELKLHYANNPHLELGRDYKDVQNTSTARIQLHLN